ncbi:PIN domain [Syntrophomonas zehnderi OL-4]|uniref:PIN domain n=1 Tax=Syntrophomonas zehnderi OL-4 TaxID=690567 RepID=A0A0E4C7J6_9FIRM|nr:PIN domain-containing protein [Syntrophomonas zehnderi]CFX03752.1 PIN domain [Syntrophomonas zehnderi OL-4]
MHKQIISSSLLLFALIFGIWSGYIANLYLSMNLAGRILVGMGGALLFYIVTGLMLKATRKMIRKFNRMLDSTSIEIVLGGAAGLLVGVLLGLITSYPLSVIEGAGAYIALSVFLLFAYLGLRIGIHRALDVVKLFPAMTAENLATAIDPPDCKVLDTSAIIDGRIYDVCLSKFLEGRLLVPMFVVEELQHIADSSDNLRRNKGRRGLELLSKMTKHPGIKIDIIEDSIPEEKEVDMKLIRLCKQINASIITNDYNLNKVAELQGINVLNLNELTNAVKVLVYPGETMHISVLKGGKEPGQGVGYLEDGTMVVVEDAQNELGNNLEVIVTSVFQTAAGRMIFTRKAKEDAQAGIGNTLQTVKMQEVNLYG